MRIAPNHLLVLTLLLALLAGSVTACRAGGTGLTSDGKLTVVVSIVPQKYFVERIGGEHVSVSVMVEPGANPATYEPKPEQLKSLSSAAVYFSIGVPFEDAWLDRIAAANADMMMVDTIVDIERMPMGEHRHEDEKQEATGAPDPHVWLSPQLVKEQSQVICEALAELDPAHEAEYHANLDAFIADIDALQAEIETTLSGLKENKFMVFHPAWGYFARDFGLEQVPVEVGGQEPSAQEMAHLIEEARKENIRVIFAQPEFSTQDAETIAQEIDGEVLLISPLAPDWLNNMRTVAQTFANVLGKEK
jgi:zinc transport system substrate-binding protein